MNQAVLARGLLCVKLLQMVASRGCPKDRRPKPRPTAEPACRLNVGYKGVAAVDRNRLPPPSHRGWGRHRRANLTFGDEAVCAGFVFPCGAAQADAVHGHGIRSHSAPEIAASIPGGVRRWPDRGGLLTSAGEPGGRAEGRGRCGQDVGGGAT